MPQYLLPFLITRQIVTGAGGVVGPRQGEDGRAEGPGRFVFSRRSDHMWEAVSSATTRTRPIINTRDEPHGDPSRRSEEHTSELQSRGHLVCRLLLEKKKIIL